MSLSFPHSTGWLLSPLPEVHADVKACENTLHAKDALERVARKLFHKDVGQGLERKITVLEDELCQFRAKRGPFVKERIWADTTFENNESHVWHQKCSLEQTKVLGEVACIVTSKMLGIGNAERAWRTAKSVMTGQRVNIGSEKAKKAAILNGAAGIELAKLRRINQEKNSEIWTDEDEAFMKELRANVNGECPL